MPSYPGGKGADGVFQRIIGMMPAHQVYVEPFLGGGAVLLAKRPARVNIAIDSHRAALDLVIPAARAVFGVAGSAIDSSDGSRSIGGHSGSGDSAGGTATPADTYRCLSPMAALLQDPLAVFGGGRQPLVGFHQGDAVAALRGLLGTAHRNLLVYCDPPYLMATRGTQRPIYRHEMGTAESHETLLEVLTRLDCMVMLSGYASPLYTDRLKGWSTLTYNVMTRGGRAAVETLWMNYPAPVELHDYRYLGEGFRERERIKKKKRRWVEKLRRMPLLERQALLAAITESHPTPSAVP